jgi:hypothetical protein
MRKLRVVPPLRRAPAALVLSVSLAWLVGCDDQKAGGVVEDKTGHGPAVTKNMENFMKAQPAPKPAAPKVQTK